MPKTSVASNDNSHFPKPKSSIEVGPGRDQECIANDKTGTYSILPNNRLCTIIEIDKF